MKIMKERINKKAPKEVRNYNSLGGIILVPCGNTLSLGTLVSFRFGRWRKRSSELYSTGQIVYFIAHTRKDVKDKKFNYTANFASLCNP